MTPKPAPGMAATLEPRASLALGRWQDVFGELTEEAPGWKCDAVITDPPYGARTAKGFRGLSRHAGSNTGHFAEGIPYGFIAASDINELVAFWTPLTRWWFVAFTDSTLAPAFVAALAGADWYTFAPLAWVKPDAAPRFTGDGPASATEWIIVARKKRRLQKSRMGSRPGFYRHGVDSEAKNNGQIVRGGKPIGLMRHIVRDYSDIDDTIVDPYAGGATTLLAAAIEGRRAIGAEMDPDTYAKAKARLARGYTPSFDFGEATP